MSFKIKTNKGKTATGDPLFLCEDASGKSFLAAFNRSNDVLSFRYYRKDQIEDATYASGVYTDVTLGTSGIKNTLTVDKSIVDALTLSGDPDGIALRFQSGLVTSYFPEITSTAWIPTGGTVDAITIDVINASGGSSNSGTGVFALAANGDGSITVTGIAKGDSITVDLATAVIATDTTYTTAKLKDGTHTVVVVSGTKGVVYTVASKTITTKVLLLSAPLDWITQNPAYAVGIGIAIAAFIYFVAIPLFKGEPVLGMGGETKKVSRSSSKRRYIDLN